MLSIAFFFLVLLNLWFVLFNSQKIVYVDGARILQEYKGAGDTKKEFDQKVEQWKKNIDTLQAEFDTAYKKYEIDEPHMTVAAKEEQRSVLSKQRQQLEDYKQAIEQNAASENSKVTEESLVKINKFLADYGKKNHYKFILIANQVGTIAYAEEGLDKTDEVLKALNDGL